MKKKNQYTPEQTFLLNGCASFSAVIGDILSAKTVDALAFIRREEVYRRDVKWWTNRVEYHRREHESRTKYVITDQMTFADVCQTADDYITQYFTQLEACLRLAMRHYPSLNTITFTKLLSALFYAEAVQAVRNAMVEVMNNKGIRATGFRSEPATLFRPLAALTKTYAAALLGGTTKYWKQANDTIQEIANNKQVSLAANNLVKHLITDILTDLINNPKQ